MIRWWYQEHPAWIDFANWVFFRKLCFSEIIWYLGLGCQNIFCIKLGSLKIFLHTVVSLASHAFPISDSPAGIVNVFFVFVLFYVDFLDAFMFLCFLCFLNFFLCFYAMLIKGNDKDGTALLLSLCGGDISLPPLGIIWLSWLGKNTLLFTKSLHFPSLALAIIGFVSGHGQFWTH